jgi:hypothetical protein
MSSHTGGSGQGESGRQQSGLIRSNEKIALIQGSRPCEGCKGILACLFTVICLCLGKL